MTIRIRYYIQVSIFGHNIGSQCNAVIRIFASVFISLLLSNKSAYCRSSYAVVQISVKLSIVSEIKFYHFQIFL